MKIGIITINDNNNYGNRLQCYALYKTLLKKGHDVKIIRNNDTSTIITIKRSIKNRLKKVRSVERKRANNFKYFNNKINETKYLINYNNPKIKENFDFFIVGSDQVWNPYYQRLSKIDLLDFNTSAKKISYAASFGVNKIPNEYIEKINKNFQKFDAISVRESSGKKIIENLTGRDDVEILPDPTMLLSTKEWNIVAKKPREIEKSCTDKEQYILNYFLGNVSKEYKSEISNIAQKNNCKIINILDKNDPFYSCGPSEFLWLEKNAFLICTDSFHSSVFAILYDRPLVVFKRNSKSEKENATTTRLDNLLEKFNIKNRYYSGKITENLLIADYKDKEDILLEERKKAYSFLKRGIK